MKVDIAPKFSRYKAVRMKILSVAINAWVVKFV